MVPSYLAGRVQCQIPFHITSVWEKCQTSVLVEEHLQTLRPEQPLYPKYQSLLKCLTELLSQEPHHPKSSPWGTEEAEGELDFWLPTQYSCWHQQEPVATLRGFKAFGALKQGCKNNHPHCPPLCGPFTQHMLGGILGGCSSGTLYFTCYLQIRLEIRRSCHTRVWKAAAGLGCQHSQPLHIQSFFSFLPAGLMERFFPCDFVIFSRSIKSLLQWPLRLMDSGILKQGELWSGTVLTWQWMNVGWCWPQQLHNDF